MRTSIVRWSAGGVGFLLWLFSIVFATQGLAQKAILTGTENAPAVGSKAPAFDLEGFDLKKQLDRGPVVLVFYRGYF
ncbi:MAG: hypothetical protein ACE5JS_15540 [Nitrospinota bacterium]